MKKVLGREGREEARERRWVDGTWRGDTTWL